MKLHGIIPPVVTPLTASGRIDVRSLRSAARRQLDAGVHGIFVLGSSGEVALLTDTDRAEIVRSVVDEVKGAVPVVAGASDTSSARLLDQIKMLRDAGADAIVATAPFYWRPTVGEIERHFRSIANAAGVPVFAYDVPVRVHTKLDPEMLVRLGDEGVLAGVKDSSGDEAGFRRLLAVNRNAGSPLRVLTGQELSVESALFAGADGAVPGLANVDPYRYVHLYELCRAREWSDAAAVQLELAKLFDIVRQATGVGAEASGIGAFKVALQQLGVIDHGDMSFPIESMGEESRERIRVLLVEAGLLLQ